MADPNYNLHSLFSRFQEPFGTVLSGSRSVLSDSPQQSGLVFGLQVEQTAPAYYLKPLIPCGESFHNPSRDSRILKVPIRVINSQEPEQNEPLDLSQKPGAHQQADKNTQFFPRQSEFRIDRVWSMPGEASSHSHLINPNHPLHTLTLKKDTAGKSCLGLGQLTLQSSSALDIHHQPFEISNPSTKNQNLVETFSTPTMPSADITPQLNLNSQQLQRNTSPAGNELGFKASASGSSESLTITPGEAYRRAYHRAYPRAYRAEMASSGDEGKAKQVGKAAAKAAGQAERERVKKSSASGGSGESLTITPGEASHRAYQRAYHRAYRAEMASSGDGGKAKQAGKAAGQAASQAERERVKESSESGSGGFLPPPSSSSLLLPPPPPSAFQPSN